ncbi:hypothetical protein ACIP6T_22715 [Pantoea sp. NPDC088449]|uniref:hypothetical protein n=1 Tax=Pantoea sp. NPDC088449 TaxID=3364392 RepID=UPI00381A323C
MKIYDTNYDPDTFGRISMGLITEMFLTYEGYVKPEIGDHLRISCMFKGVVRDVYTVVISEICECVDEENTVLVRYEKNKKIGFTSNKHLNRNNVLELNLNEQNSLSRKVH